MPLAFLRRRGLLARIAAASLVLAALLGGTFAVMVASIVELRGASAEADRADEAEAAANRLQRLLVDLETGVRGFVLTHDVEFLDPWYEGRLELPRARATLLGLVRHPEARAQAREIDEAIQRWLVGSQRPLLATARFDPDRARALITSGEAKRELDALRTRFDRFRALEQRLDAERDADLAASSRQAVAVAVGGLGGSAVLVLLFALYLHRSVLRPVARVSAASRRLAAGDLGARVAAAGSDEVGVLTESFNRMAASLEQGRESLASRAAELQSILDATEDGIMLVETSGRAVHANAPVTELAASLLLPPPDDAWRALDALAQRTRAPDELAVAIAALRDDPEAEARLDLELVDGRAFVVSTAPVRDGTGTRLGRIYTFHDVSEERRMERMKDEFVATVSHELRTPLTSLHGFLRFLLRRRAGELTEEQAKLLGVIERNTERLMRLVGDLLFIAHADAQRLRLEPGRVSLDELVEDAARAAAPLAETAEVEVVVDADTGLELDADRARLGQLLDNLIANALKFTPAGGRVTVRALHEGDRAILEVADTGIGIPLDEQGRLFERFFRARTATSREIQGSGLGLSIARAIAELHGGTIGFTSAEDAGTTFRVELPAPAAVDLRAALPQ